jgi:N-acetyl-anhydromuramyl-L-alanine amidase AmpD
MNIIQKPLPRGGTRLERKQNPDRCIIHSMGEYIRDDDGTIYHAVDWLEKCGYSAHLFISPQSIIESRDFNKDAIHAAGNNRDTIGIEWLVPGIHNYSTFIKAIKEPYLTSKQFSDGCEYILENIVKKHGILHFEKHSDVDPKGKKQDPGEGFPWNDFLKEIGVVIF